MDGDVIISDVEINKSRLCNPIIHFFPSFRNDVFTYKPTVVYLGDRWLKTTFNPHITYVSTFKKKFKGHAPVCCNVCSKVCSTTGHLRRHQTVHDKSKDAYKRSNTDKTREANLGQACSICGKVCSTSGHLKNHQGIHNKSKDVCRRSNPNKAGGAVKGHACNICGKVCARLCDLKRHQTVHNKGNTAHQDRIRNNAPVLRKNRRGYACSACGKVCSNAGNLKRHQAVHQRSKPQTIDVCEKRFDSLCNFESQPIVQDGDSAIDACFADSSDKSQNECYKIFFKNLYIHNEDKPHAYS